MGYNYGRCGGAQTPSAGWKASVEAYNTASSQLCPTIKTLENTGAGSNCFFMTCGVQTEGSLILTGFLGITETGLCNQILIILYSSIHETASV
jgi:hypothetical protein